MPCQFNECNYPQGHCAEKCMIHRRVRAGAPPAANMPMPTLPLTNPLDDQEPELSAASWVMIGLVVLILAVVAAIIMVGGAI